MTDLPAIRANIIQMPGYEPVQPVGVLSAQLGLDERSLIKVDANENPFAPFDFVQSALADLPDSNRYPDPECRRLRQVLAAYHGLPAEHLLCGAGADDLIDLMMRLFIEPGDAIINCPPTFGMYSFDADLQGGRVVNVPRKADFSLDLPAIRRAVMEFQPRLIFVTSPNNPDGSLLKPGELDELLTLPLVVVLDEAYIEFAPAGASAIRRVPSTPNLVVLRTFSKWAGLAGLRLGFGALPLWIIEQMWKIKQPYNVSVSAEEAGLASMANVEELNRVAAILIAERERLYNELNRLDWLQVYPSQSNFLLCRAVGREGRQLKADLAKRGVLVRYFNKPCLTDCIRVSVGLPADNTRIIEVFQSLA